jgi:chemotaxis protein methyltransferase CheR
MKGLVSKEAISSEQLNELIDIVKKIHGFDFSDYTEASFKRRLARIMMLKKLEFYDLKHVLVNDANFFRSF